MKTRMSLALLTLLIATGCSESDQVNLPDTPVNAVPIRIGQQVTAVSRAVAEEGVKVSATLLMCDGDDANTVDWSKFEKVDKNVIEGDVLKQLKSRASVSAASFTVGTSASDISLNQLLYYSLGGKYSFIAGVSPAGKVEDAGAVVSFTQTDGMQDVMFAETIAVGKAEDQGNADGTAKHNLEFVHKTTQLNFSIGLKRVTGGGEWQGKKIALKSISVQKASVPQSLNLATGAVSWTTPTTFKVPGVVEAAIPETAVSVSEPFMINPYSEVVIDVVITVDGAEKIFNNVRVTTTEQTPGVTTDLSREEGKSHLITLTLQEPASAEDAVTIQTTATVKAWEQGASGSANL